MRCHNGTSTSNRKIAFLIIAVNKMMDGLDSFGQLSTTAKEWKPASVKSASDRQSSFASDRSSYGSSGGEAPSFGSAPLPPPVPLSPVPQHSPIRSGLLHSPPGRTAWQQQQGGSGEFSNPYAGASKWVGSPQQQQQQQQPPPWPDGEFFVRVLL